MIRNLILAASLAFLCGCSSMRKTVTDGRTNDPPKQYEYRDMGGGDSTFRHGAAPR